MVIAGTASDQIGAVLGSAPASDAYGQVVRPVNSSAEPFHIVPTTTVGISGNATVSPAAGSTFNVGGGVSAILSTGSTGRVELSSGGVGGSSANPLHVQPTTTVPISGNTTVSPAAGSTFNVAGNTTAVLANASGAIASGNPLHVYVQDSTATLTVQGNATVAGNVTAILTSGSVVQVEPKAGATFPISGNATVAGNVTAILTSGSKVQVEPGAGATFNVAGNVTALISTAFPAYVPTNGTTASGGLLVMGLDGTATNSTARPLQVDSSGKLKVDAVVTVPGGVTLGSTAGTSGLLVYGADGTASNSTVRPLQVDASGKLKVDAAVTVGGAAQINTTGGSTMLIVGGMDGGTSDSTARALRVDASGKLLVDAAVTIGGLVDPGATAGTTAMLIAGADGQSSNSTAYVLLTDASGRLQVNVGGNTSVVGGVSAFVTTGSQIQVEPLAGTTFNIAGNATVAGNVTAILTSGSIVQTEPKSGAVFPISGNTTARVATADWAVMDFDTSAGSTLDRVAVGIVVPSTAGPVLLGTTNGLPVTLTTNSTLAVQVQGTVPISGNATAAVANSSGLVTTANPLAVYLQGSTVTINGNATVAGNVTAILTTGSKVLVEPAAGTTFNIAGNATVAGNVTAILTTGSKVQVEPAAGTSFNVAGNVTALLTTGSIVRVETGASGFAVSGNVTALLTSGSKVQTEPIFGTDPYGDATNATWANKTITASGSTALVASATGRLCITALSVINAGGTPAAIEIRSGGSATVLFSGYAASAGGGFALSFPKPLRGTTGDAINVFADAAATAMVHLSGFRSSV